MLKNILFVVLGLGLVATFQSCTKTPTSADGKPLLGRKIDPDRVVVTVNVDLPKNLEKQIKPTDLMIWTLKNNDGEMIAGKMSPVPEFPFKNEIRAKLLRKEIAESENLLFEMRVVKNGEESKPPKKGQLHLTLGEPETKEQEVVNPYVDTKRLEAYLKKMNITLPKKVTVGSNLEAELKAINF